ncbi:unnamed protein product [Pleuronectes platessa]|uniref:Uncharacterized protein n=1 Tax=Pleuronectes platessa TaxID=8262 RepID=A0A9N7V0F6_PLEPL|nr:unnamed protein product [Pleuronectes platessa]
MPTRRQPLQQRLERGVELVDPDAQVSFSLLLQQLSAPCSSPQSSSCGSVPSWFTIDRDFLTMPPSNTLIHDPPVTSVDICVPSWIAPLPPPVMLWSSDPFGQKSRSSLLLCV